MDPALVQRIKVAQRDQRKMEDMEVVIAAKKKLAHRRLQRDPEKVDLAQVLRAKVDLTQVERVEKDDQTAARRIHRLVQANYRKNILPISVVRSRRTEYPRRILLPVAALVRRERVDLALEAQAQKEKEILVEAARATKKDLR